MNVTVTDLERQLAALNVRLAGVKAQRVFQDERKRLCGDVQTRAAEGIGSIKQELTRRRWLIEPTAWIEERLGGFFWSKQSEIADAVVRHRRVGVPSCFQSGKSFTAARLAAWWIDVHPAGEAFVVTTARSGPQVKAILWRELHRAHSAGNLAGRLNQTEWWLPVEDREEMVAFGRKPADVDPSAFQGIHARYVLVILDEAAQIPEGMFEAADALITNDDSRLLAIGNPEDATSHFAEVCKPGSGWKIIRIPAFITPNFTDEWIPEDIAPKLIGRMWVEEKRRTWTETNPMWQAKVLAEFPSSQVDGLIPIKWIREAQERTLEPGLPNELGVDVGAGGDKSVIMHRRGGVVRLVKWDRNPDTMQTCGNVIHALRTKGASVAKVDEIGIGRGVVDRAREQRQPVVGVNVGQAAKNRAGFVNLRAEGYWELRELFQRGGIDLPNAENGDGPEAEDLAAQLVDLRYKRLSSSKIQIESKDEIKRRGRSSPDDADAVMLAFLDVPGEGFRVLELREF